MHKLKKIGQTLLFFIIIDISIYIILNPTNDRGFSDIYVLITHLLLNYIIVRFAYWFSHYLNLDDFNSISAIAATIGFILVLIVTLYSYFTKFGETYLITELLIKVILNNSLVVLMLFNLTYSIYKLLISPDLKGKMAAIAFEVLMVSTFILSAVVYNNYAEKQHSRINNIFFFSSIVNKAVYTLETNPDYDIHREVINLESSFNYAIYNTCDLDYAREKLVFEKMENFLEYNNSSADKAKIINYLKEFEHDFKTLIYKNSIITDRAIRNFIKNKTDEFDILVYGDISP